MAYLRLILAIICISLCGSLQAAQISYNFDLSNGLFSTNCQLLEDITGETPQILGNGVCFVADGGAYGSLTYDNAGEFAGDNGLGGSLYDATVTMTATPFVGTSDLGTASADNGQAVVNDDPGGDLLNVAISNASDNWSGFTIGDYQLVTVGAIWINGDFLMDQSLPSMLPPPSGYERAFLNFGVVNVNTPSVIEGFSAGGLVVTQVPIPGAFWMLGSGLGLLAWIRRRAS
jgi:hypothetical protein